MSRPKFSLLHKNASNFKAMTFSVCSDADQIIGDSLMGINLVIVIVFHVPTMSWLSAAKQMPSPMDNCPTIYAASP